MKPAKFHLAALNTIRGFSEEVRRELDPQKGEILAKPLSPIMSSLGRGVSKLRVKDNLEIYRVFYFTKVKDKIPIFYAFTKKTQEAPKHEIQPGQEKLKKMLQNEKE